MENLTGELDILLERTLNLMEEMRNSSQTFTPGKTPIRYGSPFMDKEDARALLRATIEAYTTGWFGFGKHARSFEDAFAKTLDVRECVFTNSGSSANLLAVGSLVSEGRLKPGDEVITPALTFPTTINPLLFYGLRPVLIDIDLPSYTLNLQRLGEATSERTRAVMFPHLNGSPSDMRTIMEHARKHDLYVVEDTCDALGSKYDGQYAGTFGHLGTTSFYVAHHMTTGEGGAVFTRDTTLALTVRSLRDWGRNMDKGVEGPEALRKIRHQTVSPELPQDYESRFTYSTIGFNLKPLDLQGALGLAQLKKLPQITEARKRNFSQIWRGLSSYQDFLLLPEALPLADASWFAFPIIVRPDAPFPRKEIVQHLEAKLIETRPILAGNIASQPAYKDAPLKVKGNLKNTNLALNNGFFIGLYPGIKQVHVEYIIESFEEFLKR